MNQIITISNSQETTVHQLFEAIAAKHPERVALVFENQSITYWELNSRADQLRNAILQESPKDEIIGLSTCRSLEMIISIFAILKAGKTYLPLDPTYPENRLQQIIEDSKIKACICLSKEIQLFKQIGLAVTTSDALHDAPSSTSFKQHPNCCILYTSGSTGKPKGVCIGHKSLINFLNCQEKTSITGTDVNALQFSHLSFDASLQEILVPLTTGGTLYVLGDDHRLDAAKLLDYLITNKINKAFFPYVTLQYLTEFSVVEGNFPLALKEVTTGGELIKVTPAIRAFFAAIPDCVIRNAYGPTEATIWITEHTLTGDPQNWPDLPSIGKPIGSTIFFLDEHLNFVGDGEIGELCVAGPCLANGYLHQPEMTSERFIEWEHPLLGKTTIYRTGDLGRYLPNGEIEFTGREDSQVKIRGNRVELAEIEIAILQQDEIRQTVVIMREDQPGTKKLVAYIVGNEKKYTSSLLRQLIASLLPDYMIPSNFIWIKEIPEKTSGKIDHQALPKPDSKRPDINTVYRRPATQTEKDITSVFISTLQYESVGIDDNFFELGGNSLLAQRTIAALKHLFKYHLPITKLYQYPTVAKLAGFLENPATSTKNERQHLGAKDESHDIAIIGMACRFPGAVTLSSYWELLTEGRETTTFFTEEELDQSISETTRRDSTYVRARGTIKDADLFDSAFFNINPKLADLMDPQQRVFLEIAWEVLEQTGHLPSKYSNKVGVFAGSGTNTYYEKNVLHHPDLIDIQGKTQVTTVNDKDFLASRTAYHLNLTGPAVSVNSACSTSLLAVHQAVTSLRSGQCDAALAGAASITSPINSGHLYQEGSMLSKDGHCRPFDNDATGTVFSDGAGVVLLKRLSDAQRDGNTIYAVITGIGSNNDGYEKGSFSAPSAKGQSDAVVMAIQDAGIAASEISMVEAHGTGTPIGDPIEFEGLTDSFGEQTKKQFCAIGSVKSNFGHLTHAAGVAGLIKACLSLYHKKIPASLGYSRPNKNIDFENSPFFVNHKLSDWSADQKRIAGVSSFGVGGTNVHVIVEAYENADPVSAGSRPYQLISWSAQSVNSSAYYSKALQSFIGKHSELKLADVAYTLHQSKEDFRYRKFLVAKDVSALSDLLNKDSSNQANLIGGLAGEVVFTFPGQGAQYLNMASELYTHEPVYRNALDKCAELLKDHLQKDIREIIFTNDSTVQAIELLKETKYTQPALFVTAYALAELWMSWGIRPTILCGHSIGEYVAAHLSGIFSLEDGLKLIASRSALINGLPKGAMLSARTDEKTLKDLLTGSLSIAAVNSPKLCVIAGPEQEIASFAELLDRHQIANKLLSTSHAFHSSMMDPVIERFEEIVAEIKLQTPGIPIISTVTGKLLTDEEAINPHYWAMHLRNTVQYCKAIETILHYDQPIFLEVGPGNVNTTLIKQIGQSDSINAFHSLKDKDNDYFSMLQALGQLWSHGLQPNWSNFYADQNRSFIHLPAYQFDRKKHWVESLKTNENFLINTIDMLDMRKNGLQSKIKQVLEDASGIEIARNNLDRNFLEIGFDSLLLTQIAISLKKEFGLPITFRMVSEKYPTINSLTGYIDENTIQINAVESSIQVPTSTINQYNTVNSPINGGANHADDTALGLISQQLELLSKQVALMYGNSLQADRSPAIVSSGISQPVNHVKQTPQHENTALSAQERLEIQKPFGATPRIDKNNTELNAAQRRFLDDLIIRYNQKTYKSKQYATESRPYMADPRVVNGFKPQLKELVYPIVINKSSGSKMWDLDGNEYIDTLNGFGSNLLGYQPEVLKKAMFDQIEKGYEVGPQHELAAEVSKLVCEFTGFDRSALCSTGSEAVLGCIRIARTVTGRSLIVAFTGSYHGIIDEVLVRGTKKLKSFPAAAGIMPEAVHNILVLDYGTDEALEIIRSRAHEIAAIIVEPVQSRRPEFVPVGFLKELRVVSTSSGSVLIFDEVITGFRMHPGGAQALFQVKADLASYGKVVGGGIPIGVIAGKKEYMDALDGGSWNYGDDSFPEAGVTYFAGTFVRHPLALASAKASLEYMKLKGPGLQEDLNKKGDHLANVLNTEIKKRSLPFFVANYGSLWKVKFHEEIPYSELMFILMREKGIHIIDGFPCFITEATTEADIDQIIKCFVESMDEMINAGFYPNTIEVTKDDFIADFSQPPLVGARIGKDQEGNPAWFIEDKQNPGKYLHVQI